MTEDAEYTFGEPHEYYPIEESTWADPASTPDAATSEPVGDDTSRAAATGPFIHFVDPVCGAKPDGIALFVRWPEVVTCPKCRESYVEAVYGWVSTTS